MKFKLLFAASLFAVNICHAQQQGDTIAEPAEKIITHKALPGETVVMIAKKYVVTPKDIYEINAEAVNGISPGTIIKVPLHKSLKTETAKTGKKINILGSPKSIVVKNETAGIPEKHAESTEKATDTTHKVKKGETLTAIAKKYHVTTEAITASNPGEIMGKLQPGQNLVIPKNGSTVIMVKEDSKTFAASNNMLPVKPAEEALREPVTHEVKPGETLTGLAKKYNTTVEDITLSNAKKLKKGLQAGQVLTIAAGAVLK